jgi:serine/threonine-protein kinase
MSLETLPRGTPLGRYIVLELLGRGGMGVVYRAFDPELDRSVAVKLLRTDGRRSAERDRLVREGRAMAKLSHPNVVAVYDVGAIDDQVFVAMELVEGATLRDWAKAPKRSWREIVATYVQAGRGLAAAHAAGMVHRDFKPDNALVGTDGRARVLDFGVARDGEPPADDPAPGTGPGATSGESSSYAFGSLSVGGTPRYMAPEQYEGKGISASADQFAFCASLWEALYGDSPFEGDDLLARLANIRAGRLRATPAGEVPAHVRAVPARGLSANPSRRYASMNALLAVLEHRPAWVRRSVAAVTAVGVLGLASVVMASRRGPADPCAHPERDLAGVWDETQKQRVLSSFVATGRPYAEDTARRVFERLDAYAGSYAKMRGEVCVASRGAGAAGGILALREACLDRRRGQLQALAAVFGEKSDTGLLDKAVAAATGLPPITYCADTEALTARVRPPEEPALRARVEALQRDVDQLEARYVSGQYKEGLALGEPLLSATKDLGYPWVPAQARWWLAQIRERRGEFDDAKALLRDGVADAAAARDDVLVAQMWARLLYIAGERQRRFDEAEGYRAFGPTLVARANDDGAEAAWAGAEGMLLFRTGKLDDATEHLEHALAKAERAYGPEHLQVASVLNNLAVVQNEKGDREGALGSHERALDIRRRALGEDHPSVAQSLNNIGLVYLDGGDYLRARDQFARSREIWERAVGPEHVEVAQVISNLADALQRLGQWSDAITLDERALAMREKLLPEGHPDIGQSLYNLGDVVMEEGDAARAATLFQRSLAILEKALGPRHRYVGFPLCGLGRARVRLRQLDEARTLLERAVALYASDEKANDEPHATALLGMGELQIAQNRVKDAVPTLERALAMAVGGTRTEVLLTLAQALRAEGGDPLRVRALVEEARAYYASLGHDPGMRRATGMLADRP